MDADRAKICIGAALARAVNDGLGLTVPTELIEGVGSDYTFRVRVDGRELVVRIEAA